MQTASAAGKKSGFYKSLMVLALPLLLQNLMNSAVSAADTLMLGFVGQNQLAASSLAGNLQFLVNMFIYGIGSGSSVLIAQYWGRKDYETIERTIGIALRFTLAVGLVFSCAALFAPAGVMRIYTTDADLINYGVQYLRIVGFGYLLNSFTQVYISAQRAMERVMFGTVVNMISMVLNVILNACFIFGVGPFPELLLVHTAQCPAGNRLPQHLLPQQIPGVGQGLLQLGADHTLRFRRRQQQRRLQRIDPAPEGDPGMGLFH